MNSPPSMENAATRATDFGDVRIGTHMLLYQVPPALRNNVSRGAENIKRINLRSGWIRGRRHETIPQSWSRVDEDGSIFISLSRIPNSIRLRDLVAYHGGHLPLGHVAWIISSLLAIACYLQEHAMSHNNITPDSVYVHPGRKSAGIFDYWAYSQAPGQSSPGLPAFGREHVECIYRWEEMSRHFADLVMIKALGQYMLGVKEISGKATQGPASPLSIWLSSIPDRDPLGEQAKWIAQLAQTELTHIPTSQAADFATVYTELG